MKKPLPPLIDEDGEVREITAEDMREFRPAREVVSSATLAAFRGPQKAPTKVSTTIRFDADVLAALKASGPGWQTRVNDAVREMVRKKRIG